MKEQLLTPISLPDDSLSIEDLEIALRTAQQRIRNDDKMVSCSTSAGFIYDAASTKSGLQVFVKVVRWSQGVLTFDSDTVPPLSKDA